MSHKDEGAEEERSVSAARGAGPIDPPPELGKEIAKQLKALYGRKVAEPLPDKFTALLNQLAESERKR